MSLKSGMMIITIATLADLLTRRKNKYNFDLRDTERWFDVMLANGTLTLPETHSQTQPGDELSSRYFRYHRRLNHGTSYCNALPYIIHERIARGELKNMTIKEAQRP